MHGVKHHVIFGIDLNQCGSEQRSLCQIKWRLSLQPGNRFDLTFPIIFWDASQIDLLERNSHLRMDNLIGSAALRMESGSQRFMPKYHFVQALFQRIDIEVTLESNRFGNVVERAVGLQLIEEPQSLLGK